MKVSELMRVLEDLQEQHGDIDCVLIDADTEWSWELKPENVYFSTGDAGTGAAVVFKELYGDATDYTWPEPVKPERFVGPLSSGQAAISNAMHSLLRSMLSNRVQQGAEPSPASYAPGETISIKRPVRFTYRAGADLTLTKLADRLRIDPGQVLNGITEQSPSQGRSTTEQSTGE